MPWTPSIRLVSSFFLLPSNEYVALLTANSDTRTSTLHSDEVVAGGVFIMRHELASFKMVTSKHLVSFPGYKKSGSLLRTRRRNERTAPTFTVFGVEGCSVWLQRYSMDGGAVLVTPNINTIVIRRPEEDLATVHMDHSVWDADGFFRVFCLHVTRKDKKAKVVGNGDSSMTEPVPAPFPSLEKKNIDSPTSVKQEPAAEDMLDRSIQPSNIGRPQGSNFRAVTPLGRQTTLPVQVPYVAGSGAAAAASLQGQAPPQWPSALAIQTYEELAAEAGFARRVSRRSTPLSSPTKSATDVDSLTHSDTLSMASILQAQIAGGMNSTPADRTRCTCYAGSFPGSTHDPSCPATGSRESSPGLSVHHTSDGSSTPLSNSNNGTPSFSTLFAKARGSELVLSEPLSNMRHSMRLTPPMISEDLEEAASMALAFVEQALSRTSKLVRNGRVAAAQPYFEMVSNTMGKLMAEANSYAYSCMVACTVHMTNMKLMFQIARSNSLMPRAEPQSHRAKMYSYILQNLGQTLTLGLQDRCKTLGAVLFSFAGMTASIPQCEDKELFGQSFSRPSALSLTAEDYVSIALDSLLNDSVHTFLETLEDPDNPVNSSLEMSPVMFQQGKRRAAENPYFASGYVDLFSPERHNAGNGLYHMFLKQAVAMSLLCCGTAMSHYSTHTFRKAISILENLVPILHNPILLEFPNDVTFGAGSANQSNLEKAKRLISEDDTVSTRIIIQGQLTMLYYLQNQRQNAITMAATLLKDVQAIGGEFVAAPMWQTIYLLPALLCNLEWGAPPIPDDAKHSAWLLCLDSLNGIYSSSVPDSPPEPRQPPHSDGVGSEGGNDFKDFPYGYDYLVRALSALLSAEAATTNAHVMNREGGSWGTGGEVASSTICLSLAMSVCVPTTEADSAPCCSYSGRLVEAIAGMCAVLAMVSRLLDGVQADPALLTGDQAQELVKIVSRTLAAAAERIYNNPVCSDPDKGTKSIPPPMLVRKVAIACTALERAGLRLPVECQTNRVYLTATAQIISQTLQQRIDGTPPDGPADGALNASDTQTVGVLNAFGERDSTMELSPGPLDTSPSDEMVSVTAAEPRAGEAPAKRVRMVPSLPQTASLTHNIMKSNNLAMASVGAPITPIPPQPTNPTSTLTPSTADDFAMMPMYSPTPVGFAVGADLGLPSRVGSDFGGRLTSDMDMSKDLNTPVFGEADGLGMLTYNFMADALGSVDF